jgi:hypothetical protein
MGISPFSSWPSGRAGYRRAAPWRRAVRCGRVALVAAAAAAAGWPRPRRAAPRWGGRGCAGWLRLRCVRGREDRLVQVYRIDEGWPGMITAPPPTPVHQYIGEM